MELFLNVLGSQSVLLIYVLTGLLVQKLGLIQSSHVDSFVNLILYVALPMMIFNSANMEITEERLHGILLIGVYSLAISLFSLILGQLVFRWRISESDRKILCYGLLCNNAGFAGMPLLSYAFGQESLFYASIFLIPLRVLLWSAGVAMFTKTTWKIKLRNIFLNPATVAVALGLLRVSAEIEFHPTIEIALHGIGGITAPFAMITVGCILGEVSPRSMLDVKVFYFCLIRLVIFPGIVLASMRLIHAEFLLTVICVILSAMPAGANTALMARKFGADDRFASKCVSVSTVLSMVTVPAIALFL
jgi:predicted permease